FDLELLAEPALFTQFLRERALLGLDACSCLLEAADEPLEDAGPLGELLFGRFNDVVRNAITLGDSERARRAWNIERELKRGAHRLDVESDGCIPRARVEEADGFERFVMRGDGDRGA